MVLERDQHTPERHAADERLGAVDRIDDPAPAARAARLAELFAEDPVAGERGRQRGPQPLLGPAVGDRNGTAVGFRLDHQPRLEVAEREAARFVGSAACDRELVGIGGGHRRLA